jgi:uncharacterized membrane protein YeiB
VLRGFALPLVLGGITLFARDGFSELAAARWLYCPYEFEVWPAAVANAAVVLLIMRKGWLEPVTKALANVGRTAFTNYIGTSVLCQAVALTGPLAAPAVAPGGRAGSGGRVRPLLSCLWVALAALPGGGLGP